MRISGYLEEHRALGGVAFALVRDVSGTTQVTLKKGVTDPALFDLLSELPRESVIEVEGVARRSEKSQRGVEVLPSRIRVLSRSEVPLPLGVVDKVSADLPTRLDHRVIDLRKPAVHAVFELRSHLLAAFRATFVEHGFLEVETPKLLREGAEGGTTLFPVRYFDTTAYLAQSPQLYKQMLMSAGFERVFEIAPAFRAEPSDTVRHLTEFASLDAELAYIDSPDDVRSCLESIIQGTVNRTRASLTDAGNPLASRLPEVRTPFPRIPFATAEEWRGRPGAEIDLGSEDEKAIGERAIAEFGNPFYFLTDFPTKVKERTFYAQRLDDRPNVTGYFDLDFNGTEVASGGAREHRLDRLEANIRSAGLDPSSFASYLEAFRFGMPPHGGWGLGIDRLVWLFSGVSNVREARLFPRDRYRLDP